MIHDWDDDCEDEDDAADEALWQEFMRSVKPLRRSKEVIKPTPPSIKTVLPKNIREDLPVMRDVTPSPLPQRQVKKLRTQRIAIEARIDLHGYRLDAAHQAVEQFIHNAMRSQMRCLEIITGKGNPDKGTGQLRLMVPQWLQESALQPMILHVEPNPASRGGSLLILLRRHKHNI